MHSSILTGLSTLSLYARSSHACAQDMLGHHHVDASSHTDMLQEPFIPRPARPRPPQWRKTAISNVRVFDGYNIQPPSTVFFEGERITENAQDVDVFVDGHGGILLPGLFDSHAHPNTIQDMEALSSYGVTTVMSMACHNYTRCALLRDHIGLTSYFTAGIPAHAPNSPHAIATNDPPEKLISHPREAPQWVENVFSNGSDYMKITAEKNGPSQATQNALVALAHAKGKKVMTHAAEYEYYVQAIKSGANGPQHIPMDALLTDEDIEMMVAGNMFATPTTNLYKIVLKKLAIIQPEAAKGLNYTEKWNTVQQNVRNLHVRGIPILAGTDSTKGDRPITLPFGDWLHEEIANLVDIGLTPEEALRAATIVPATAHEIPDRGRIAPGLRADLVLLKPNANPLQNIRDTRLIARVWNGGVEFEHVHPNTPAVQKVEQVYDWTKGLVEAGLALVLIAVATVTGGRVGKTKLF